MPKPKKYLAENDYDATIGCTVCGAAIHQNTLVSVSKDKIRCPVCNAIFTPKSEDFR